MRHFFQDRGVSAAGESQGPRPRRAGILAGQWLLLTVVLLTVVLGNLLFAAFVASEHTLYSADYVAYWAMSASVAEGLRTRPLTTLLELTQSVATRELNLLPALPPALFMVVFGSSRTAYVLAVLNLYALPALLLAAALLRRLTPPPGGPSMLSAWWAVVVTTLLLPAYWWPISLGYLGVGGVLLGLAALLLYFAPSETPRSTLRLVSLGALLTLVFLFRRWYAFWSVAFLVMILADALSELWLGRKSLSRSVWRILREPLVVGGAAAVTAVAVAWPMVWRILHTDYADRFAFYKTRASLAGELAGWLQHLGIVGAAFVLLSGGVVVLRPAGRRVGLLLGLLLMASGGLFRRVQDPSPQHWYLIFPVILVVGSSALLWLVGRSPSQLTRSLTVAGISALAVLQLVAVSVLPAGRLLPVAPGLRFAGQHRDDLGEVMRLLAVLDRQLTTRPGYIYVLGSSLSLSSTGLAFANLSLGTDFGAPRLILDAAHVDHRDGFPAALLEARYVVLSEPVQTRRPPLGQWVVELPARQILEARGVGAAFARWPQSFSFDGGVEVFVYERIRPSTPAEIAVLSRELQAHYPDRPEIWRAPTSSTPR